MMPVSRRDFLSLAAAATLASPLAPERELARKLVGLYEAPSKASRWRSDGATVDIAGVQAPRRLAYRDDRLFPLACGLLLESAVAHERRLGAWLLESAGTSNRDGALRLGRAHVASADRVARFHVLKSLLALGDRDAVIRACIHSSQFHDRGLLSLARSDRVDVIGLRRDFTPGACFWFEGYEDDFGAAQFAKLARFGVREASLHTFEPLQQGRHNPVLRESRRNFGASNLAAWVASAKRASLEVTVKPHLEMGFRRLSDAERRIFEKGSGAERQSLRAAFEKERADVGWHGDIEMTSDADWKRWFVGYRAYLLPHAQTASSAGASVFCVGREIDKTVLGRESSWRALIKDVREVFKGRLVYSAHHDTFDRLPFWDALDVIGVSAYPQVDLVVPPRKREVQAGWARFVLRCDALAKKWKKPLTWTEVGYPAVTTAAREPWKEDTSAAEVILQSQLLGEALDAAQNAASVRGTCVWLWEGVSDPPFTDRSFTVQDKPAAYAMAGAYRKKIDA